LTEWARLPALTSSAATLGSSRDEALAGEPAETAGSTGHERHLVEGFHEMNVSIAGSGARAEEKADLFRLFFGLLVDSSRHLGGS
jgi:hypothetical protein